jgi:tripartite-type tricarboxylate transporter receptor subunit TctC
MNRHMNRRTAVLGSIVAVAGMPLPLRAQASFPGGPLKVIVGVPAGGTTDMMGRLIAQELAEALGTTAIVENRAGASGIIAGAYVAKSPPDGTTLLMAASSHATVPFLYKSMPYDTDKDLVPVGLISATPYVLVIHPSVPAASLTELLQLIRKNPGKFSYASSSAGTAPHLAGEMLRKLTGTDMVHVPYKGSGTLVPDLLAGRVPMMFENVAVMTPHIRSGAMRPIAVTSPKRVSTLPDVPTMSEAGLPGFEVLGWFALWAPAGTPRDVVQKLNTHIAKIVTKPSFVKRLSDVGAEPMGGSPERLAQWMKSEQTKWGGLIKEIGITQQ